ncbi:kelch domain-containing protein 10-like [Clavelina lepadiformis]|uniref:Kelch domain-containing protein 10 n=1 Tax=Clavelina lepadiformis TaxID=159417 RepID=A0ABP0GD83_CLALP
MLFMEGPSCSTSSLSGGFCLKMHQFVKMEFPGNRKPSARSGHRSVADDNHVWLIGGYNSERNSSNDDDNDSYPLFRELWEYNISTNKWKLHKKDENMPHELASHSAISNGSCMVIFGGTGVPFGEKTSNQLSACQLKTGKWNVIECSGVKPDKIYGQAMVFIGQYLYIYGGTTGYEYNTDLHRLNLKTFVWENLNPANSWNDMPPERYRHEIAQYDNHIFVIGGGTLSSVYQMDQIHVYSTEKNLWRLVQTKPDPKSKLFPNSRRCHSCVQLENKAFICGGYDGRKILEDLWQFELDSLQWTKLAIMPEPVYFHSAAVTTEGCMIIFGGVSRVSSRLNSNSTIRTDSCYRIWLRIPSLQIMCWLTLVQSRPRIRNMTRIQLFNMGITPCYLKKLQCAEGA